MGSPNVMPTSKSPATPIITHSDVLGEVVLNEIERNVIKTKNAKMEHTNLDVKELVI